MLCLEKLLSFKSMKEMNSIYKQKGTFTIEFALVGVFFAMLLLFSVDMLIKLSMKGKLDRLSYSIVSVLKERTQLYEGRDNYLQDSEGELLFTVVKNSLARNTGNFDASKLGMRIEEQTYQDDINFTPNTLVTKTFPANACPVGTSLSSIEEDLSVESTWRRKTTLYRVTLCYETDNLIADILSNGFTKVQSSSVIIAR